jgi:hypothetical protein
MNIYVVTRTDAVAREEYAGAVVCAASAEEAKNVNPRAFPDSLLPSEWLPKNLSVELIGTTPCKSQKCFLSDFAA